MATRPRRRARRGRPKGSTIPIERHPERFEMVCWHAFVGMGCGAFDAARRALLVAKGGPITIEDIEGVLRLASSEIPLPQPYDPDDKDKGLRRLSAKANRQPPSEWLITSSALLQAVVVFIARGNLTGACMALDSLIARGWGPIIEGLAQRIQAAIGSNLPPADLDKLSPAVRQILKKMGGN